MIKVFSTTKDTSELQKIKPKSRESSIQHSFSTKWNKIRCKERRRMKNPISQFRNIWITPLSLAIKSQSIFQAIKINPHKTIKCNFPTNFIKVRPSNFRIFQVFQNEFLKLNMKKKLLNIWTKQVTKNGWTEVELGGIQRSKAFEIKCNFSLFWY